MRFLFPLGLLGLIGIPIVILIYILRNKFNEQTVPSTYLWELSERFFKRRNPLSGLTGIISLVFCRYFPSDCKAHFCIAELGCGILFHSGRVRQYANANGRRNPF